MMRDATIVVLSRFPEIFEGFRECVDGDAPEMKKTVVWDALAELPWDVGIAKRERWRSIQIGDRVPFHIAKSANIGWKNTEYQRPPHLDIIYSGDDVRFIEPDTIKRLRNVAEIYPDVGILAPRIKGQDHDHFTAITTAPVIPFVCVLIKREVIDTVGYLDERFTGYGVEDLDFCYRTRKAGFKIAYADQVHIQHGVDGQKWGSTFRKVRGEKQMAADDAENWKRFAEKWDLPDDRAKMWDAINGVRP